MISCCADDDVPGVTGKFRQVTGWQPESKAVVPPAAVTVAGAAARNALLKLVNAGRETVQEVAAAAVPVKNGLATKLVCADAAPIQAMHSTMATH